MEHTKIRSKNVTGKLDPLWNKRLERLLVKMHLTRYQFTNMAVKELIKRFERACNEGGNTCDVVEKDVMG